MNLKKQLLVPAQVSISKLLEPAFASEGVGWGLEPHVTLLPRIATHA